MRTYSTQVKVEPAHLDAGNHVNWLAQLKITERVHFALREEIGLGIELLKSDYGLFLVMGRIHDCAYQRQLRAGDLIDIEMRMWRSRPTCFEFTASLSCRGQSAAVFRWTMPLVALATGRICVIPEWMVDRLDELEQKIVAKITGEQSPREYRRATANA